MQKPSQLHLPSRHRARPRTKVPMTFTAVAVPGTSKTYRLMAEDGTEVRTCEHPITYRHTGGAVRARRHGVERSTGGRGQGADMGETWSGAAAGLGVRVGERGLGGAGPGSGRGYRAAGGLTPRVALRARQQRDHDTLVWRKRWHWFIRHAAKSATRLGSVWPTGRTLLTTTTLVETTTTTESSTDPAGFLL